MLGILVEMSNLFLHIDVSVDFHIGTGLSTLCVFPAVSGNCWVWTRLMLQANRGDIMHRPVRPELGMLCFSRSMAGQAMRPKRVMIFGRKRHAGKCHFDARGVRLLAIRQFYDFIFSVGQRPTLFGVYVEFLLDEGSFKHLFFEL